MFDDLPLMTVPEAARILRVGRDFLYREVRSGKLRVVRVGRKILVPRRSLDEWVESHMEAPWPVG